MASKHPGDLPQNSASRMNGAVSMGKTNHGFDNFEAPPAFTEKAVTETDFSDYQETEGQKKVKVDLYDVTAMDLPSSGLQWSEMTTIQKVVKVLTVFLGILFALSLLYIFICALDILTSSFQLLTGRVAADALSNNVILNNPIAGLMIGVIATVLLQSSSTSTSIVVAMVGANVLTVKQGIFIVMGANIGTSVTNTIVSLTQSMDKEQFRRSFAGATVHDMFNWLTVLILLPIEAATAYLYHLTNAIVSTINIDTDSDMEAPQFLKVITKPLTDLIVKVDKSTVNAEAEGIDRAKYPLCKYYCHTEYDNYLESWTLGTENMTYVEVVQDRPWTVNVELVNDTENGFTNLTWRDLNNQSTLCTHLFTGCGVANTSCSLSDEAVGGILFTCAITILLTAVFILVKVLGTILKGPMTKAIRVGINAKFPGKAGFLTGYVAIFLGAGLTILVQSSSVFTSTLTPLVGLGLISVSRMFPLTLGANIGTCITGILAALTASSSSIHNTLQVALAHLFFNISGIMLFYPIPRMRRLPIDAAKFMGNTTAEYRWFAVAYLLVLYFAFPISIFALSLAGWKVLVGVLAPFLVLAITVIVVKLMQKYCPQKMAPVCRTWNWLPKPLRSLQPCNTFILKCCFNESCIRCRSKYCSKCAPDEEENGEEDPSKTQEQAPQYEAIMAEKMAPNGFINVAYNDEQTRL